jgi:uncharacterized protein (UPF0548 family)
VLTVFLLRKPSAAALARLVERESHCPLTYPELGATDRTLPPGYRHDHWETELGEFSQERFDRLAGALNHWQAQLGSGMTIFPGEPVRPGLTFALSFRLPAGYVAAAGRVIYVTDEPARRGFAYGTLPSHPEQGEESFHVTRRGPSIVFEVTAFSRPQQLIVWLGAPVGRALQLRYNHSYLRAMRQAAEGLD